MKVTQNIKPVRLYHGAANAVSCDTICCKNAHKVTFLVSHSGSSDTDLVLSLYEATDVASGTNAAVTTACPIEADTDAGTSSDTLVAQTAASGWTIDTGSYANQIFTIEWDPAKHTAGYDCVYLSASGGNANNNCMIYGLVETRYPQAVPPSAIID